MEPIRRELEDPTAAVYHRKIRIIAEPGKVRGDIADGPHHFRVWLRHDGKQVTEVAGEAVRHPWTTCPHAAGELSQLVGMPLAESSTAVGRFAEPTLNCTHMFDLAGLMVAQAARGTPRRDYHCRVHDDSSGVTYAECQRDGEPVLDWQIRDGVIVGPPPFEGVPLQRQFIRWAEAHLDPETAEAAIVLRRGWFVSPVRFFDISQWERASDLGNGPVCYTFQPERADGALRVPGSYRDFSQDPEALLPDEGTPPAGPGSRDSSAGTSE